MMISARVIDKRVGNRYYDILEENKYLMTSASLMQWAQSALIAKKNRLICTARDRTGLLGDLPAVH
jgi:hypothetical protein